MKRKKKRKERISLTCMQQIWDLVIDLVMRPGPDGVLEPKVHEVMDEYWPLNTAKMQFNLLFIVTAAAFRPKNKYILSFVQSCMETFLRVGSHISNCSSLVVLLSSYLRKPILPLLLWQKFTIACKKGRRNFLSLSSSRRGKKKKERWLVKKVCCLFFF